MHVASRVYRLGHLLWSSEALALISVLFMGVIIQYLTLFAFSAVVASLVLVLAAVVPRWADRDRSVRRLTIAAVALSLFFALWRWRVYVRIPTVVLAAVVVVIALLIVMSLFPESFKWLKGRGLRLVVSVLLGASIVLLGLTATLVRDLNIDVLDLHRSAATAVENGMNPYVHAFAWNSSPGAPAGSAFHGYVYPPSTLTGYVTADLALGDPRWASVIAAIAFVVLVLAPWSHMSPGIGSARAALALVFASIPQLGYFIWGSWTDLLALPFVLGSGLLWSKRPMASAVLLGLALSTKPYFVVALPLLLLWKMPNRFRRTAVVGLVVLATYVPFALIDLDAIVGTIQRGLPQVYRSDSSGLAGIGINTPASLSYLATLVVGCVLAVRGGSTARWVLSLAAVLGMAFVTGAQVFINYWMLVAGLVIASIVLTLNDDRSSLNGVVSPSSKRHEPLEGPLTDQWTVGDVTHSESLLQQG